MEWKLVKINSLESGRSTPYASVGLGRISLGVSACQLIKNFGKYNYACFYVPEEGPREIGIKFSEEELPYSCKIKRRKNEGVPIEYSCEFVDKLLATELFGVQGTSKKSVRYSVKLDADDETMLRVYAR